MEFPELFRKYLAQSSYNHIEFAKMCEIDRSLLQKYLRGERKPKNLEQIMNFSDKLMLSENERKEFVEAYEIFKLGKTLYFQRKAVDNIVKLFSELRKNDIVKIDREYVGAETREITVITGKINIIMYVQNILYNESLKKNVKFR